MRRRNFLKAVAALVASPALLLKKRKREADRSVYKNAIQIRGPYCVERDWPDGKAGPEFDFFTPLVTTRYLSTEEASRIYAINPELFKQA